MNDATKLVISQACQREGITLHPLTEFSNIAPGVYQWTQYQAGEAPTTKVAVIKGYEVAIYDN